MIGYQETTAEQIVRDQRNQDDYCNQSVIGWGVVVVGFLCILWLRFQKH